MQPPTSKNTHNEVTSRGSSDDPKKRKRSIDARCGVTTLGILARSVSLGSDAANRALEETRDKKEEEMESITMNRRGFLKTMGALGATAAVGMGTAGMPVPAFADDAEFPPMETGKPVEARIDKTTGDVTVNENVIVRYSACLGCYSSCGNRLKLDRETGELLSVGGNPYHPSCALPYLNFDAPLEDAYRSMSYGGFNSSRSTLCGRGNGMLDGNMRPDRVTVPLKRAGARGEGNWKAISWDQLISEVTEGGKLFAEIGEDREIEGFKALHDTTTPMNPEQPDLGPVSNQFVFFGGRGDGRSIQGRFVNNFGSVNSYGHGAT